VKFIHKFEEWLIRDSVHVNADISIRSAKLRRSTANVKHHRKHIFRVQAPKNVVKDGFPRRYAHAICPEIAKAQNPVAYKHRT
jgi:hypothetical protein